MIRFRQLLDVSSEAEQRRLAGIQNIFRKAFPYYEGGPAYVERLMKSRVTKEREILVLVAENERREVGGFSIVYFFPDTRHAYLDWIASNPERSARGIGGALYEATREMIIARGGRGLFLDVPPDDPKKLADPSRASVNRRRLAFYERYGALPVAGTRYEDMTSAPKEYYHTLLVYDPLGRKAPLRRTEARKAVFRILTRKYGLKPKDPHVVGVLRSFRDDPVRLRPQRYARAEPVEHLSVRVWLKPLKLVVAERHDIHHLRTKGYVERPVRMRAVLRGLEDLPVEQREVRHFGLNPIKAVHDRHMVAYIETLCRTLGPKDLVYPNVFPIRHPERRPRVPEMRAGYFCIDTFTPLTQNVFRAARAAVDATLSAAELLAQGDRAAYALVRPPGHHAERAAYGGFCYFNNAAIAAHRLSAHGKVALLDIDHHHGNGSQDIFYRRRDVLTVSLHGNPRGAYPYFSGYADERGEGEGLGFNRNFPLRPGTDDGHYIETLDEALGVIKRFKPETLVLSLGFDIMRGDPTGTFVLTVAGLRAIGERIGRMGLPTLIVQEGGYSMWNLRRGAHAFFSGLLKGML